MSETKDQLSSVAQDSINTFEIPLAGLSCMGCAKKVSNAVNAIAGVTGVRADKDSMSVTGKIALNEVFGAVDNLGYTAGHHVSLTLSGLRCGKCVAKLTKAFDDNPFIASHDVSKTQADVRGVLAKDDVISIIDAAGYQVVLMRGVNRARKRCFTCL
nr:heavy-metal-associated domain-containing protein [Veronia nyctiphanis]